MAHDIAALESKIRALESVIVDFHATNHADHLAHMIYRPGYTTNREHEMVKAHVDSLHSQATSLREHFAALMIIADKIGK